MSIRRIGALNPMFGKPKSSEFIAMQRVDRSGANNPQFGVVKSAETVAKLTRLIYVYNLNFELLGSYSTVGCLSQFKMGSDTLSKYIMNGKAYKGRYFRHTAI